MSETAAPNSPLNVLVVDDDEGIRKALTACLAVRGHTVNAVETSAEAVDLAAARSFDLAFVDLLLGKESGLDLVCTLLEHSPWMKVVVITAFASIPTAVESIKRGAFDYLPKPFTPAQVSLVTQRVAQFRSLEQRVAGLEEALSHAGPEADLATRSPPMLRALKLARDVADSDATVLLRGESGTGKGVLARAIHGWSRRAHKSFATVACPALSQSLLESELFGHVRGAFTGALRDNPGRIAATEGGTLFLDEIGDLPIPLQPKLLRFLQDRAYERVGDHATRRADVRIITATNVDLERSVAEGAFREDLLYRINVIRIDLPPLRDRTEDIPELSDRLLRYFSRERRNGPLRLSPAAMDVLRSYPWPGNVRELRNVLERAAIVCKQEEVSPHHLGLMASPVAAAQLHKLPVAGDRITLGRLEESHIREVLKYASSFEAAARILDIDEVTLWRKRRKYRL